MIMKTTKLGKHIVRRVKTAGSEFKPLLPLIEVWNAASDTLVGTIYRTYRNDLHLIPGRPVWIYLLAGGAVSGIENFVSAEACLDEVANYYQRQKVALRPEPPLPLELLTIYVALPVKNAATARAWTIKLIGGQFTSFTVTDSTGWFQGEQEAVLRVEIATSVPQQVVDIAAVIRAELKQDGVGVAFRGRYLRVTKDASLLLED
jgi:hypothetical protein